MKRGQKVPSLHNFKLNPRDFAFQNLQMFLQTAKNPLNYDTQKYTDMQYKGWLNVDGFSHITVRYFCHC